MQYDIYTRFSIIQIQRVYIFHFPKNFSKSKKNNRGYNEKFFFHAIVLNQLWKGDRCRVLVNLNRKEDGSEMAGKPIRICSFPDYIIRIFVIIRQASIKPIAR